MDAYMAIDAGEAAALARPETIRARCQAVFERVAAGGGQAFTLDLAQMPVVVAYVAQTVQARYPDGAIPLHGRLGHLTVGDPGRVARFLAPVGDDPLERLRTLVELIAVSVLIDAGAGPDWGYVDAAGRRHVRSEGLAVASVDLVASGLFSDDPRRPWRVAAGNLMRLSAARLGRGLQVGPDNPIEGLDGRLALLHCLGSGCVDRGRIGRIADPWFAAGTVAAAEIFATLVGRLAPLWPGGYVRDGANLGDVWPYDGAGAGSGLVPFHKLLQWLVWSLLDPLRDAGVRVTGQGVLTGLPEYRNGGLFIDLGVILPRDPDLHHRVLSPGDPAVVEWRALTVALLDGLRAPLAARLGCGEMSLGQVLEGGSWAAGRRIAAERRPGGMPPLQVRGGGSIF